MTQKQRQNGKFIFRKLKLMFSGFVEYAPQTGQQYIMIRLLYKTYRYVEELNKLSKKFKELAENQDIRDKIKYYKDKISNTKTLDKMKGIARADYQNLEGQILNSASYEVEIKDRINRSLKWVEPFIDTVHSFEMKHFEKMGQVKFAIQYLAHSGSIIKGLEDDYEETKELVDQIYQKFIQDVQYLNVFQQDSKYLLSKMVNEISEISLQQKDYL